MPSKPAPLGSRSPSLPQIVHVSPSTCHNISLFKEILKEYRRLDDTIVMRLNRANAFVRDRERARESYGTSTTETVQDQACLGLWKELVGNWKRRTQLVAYCVSVVDRSLDEKRTALQEQLQSSDPASQRKTQADIFSDEVKRNQVRNELTVESIIRKRAADAFNSRCQYFIPPPSDEESRRVWEKARQ